MLFMMPSLTAKTSASGAGRDSNVGRILVPPSELATSAPYSRKSLFSDCKNTKAVSKFIPKFFITGGLSEDVAGDGWGCDCGSDEEENEDRSLGPSSRRL